MRERLTGYVRIRVSGSARERFLNMCRMKKIRMWDLREKKDEDAIVMCMNGRDLLETKNAIRKSGVKVAVLEKNGLPFFYRKLWKRIVFVAGILFCAAFLIAMMQKIWCVRFEGNRMITDDELISYLETCGVKIGTNIRDLSYEELEAGIRREFGDVTWASVVRRGTTLIVRIKENEFYNQTAVFDDHTDLTADYDGEIVSMIVREGVPLVAIGDTVERGDILVQGAIPVYDENSEISRYRYCHAQADIVVRTSETYEQTISRVHTVRHYGKTHSRFRLGIVNLHIPIGFRVQGEQVITRRQTHQLALFQYLYLPFYFDVIEEIPYETTDEVYSEEEAEALLLAELEKYLNTLSEKGVQIIRKDVKIVKDGLNMRMTAELVLLRNTGISTETTVEFTEHGEEDG